MTIMGWIGVDLDGTLAEYGGWQGADHIGAPIPLMVDRVKTWLAAGQEVRIMTARVSNDYDASIAQTIRDWCKLHLGRELDVTCRKDYGMIELWDDRAIQVECNTGRRIGGPSL